MVGTVEKSFHHRDLFLDVEGAFKCVNTATVLEALVSEPTITNWIIEIPKRKIFLKWGMGGR